jgi:acetyltransferase-like isoleucine patch superfamily enzyme
VSLPRALGRTSVRLYATYRRLSSKAFSVAARGAFASFGARSVIELPVRLKGEFRISVGSDVYVGAGSWLQVLDGPDRHVAITIGDGTSIAGNCVLSSTYSIRIGRSVLIARNVYVADHSHAFDDTTAPVLEQGIAGVEAVEIGDGAWLGQNVVVCPGVRIGRGAVVGANAVVLDDVPDFAVAVGAPARVVREIAPREARA